MDWPHVFAIVIPLLMNWWEVKNLRRDLRKDMQAMEARHTEALAGVLASQAALEIRVAALEKAYAQAPANG